MRRPSLLALTAAAATLAMLANGAAVAGIDAGAGAQERPSSLGSRIEADIGFGRRAETARARQLDLREKAAAALESRLASSGAEAAAAAANPPVDPRAERYGQLARIYQAMKPAKAAPVFEVLDLDVQVGVARLMRERATAALLGAMQPERAARLSMALATGGKGLARTAQAAPPAAAAPVRPAKR